MTEDTNKDIVETKETQVQIAEEKPPIKTEQNEQNWKKFREDREKERQLRIEAEKEAERRKQEAEAIKKALEAVVNKKGSIESEYDFQDESDEDRIKKQIRQAVQEETERLRNEARDRENREMPNRLKQEFPDFNTVCTSENLDYLEYHHPEIATPYRYMPESYEKWSGIYRAIKRHIPYQNIDKDKQRIEQNSKKPQANVPSITDTSPQTQGWKLTEEQRRSNWARMQNDMKNIAS